MLPTIARSRHVHSEVKVGLRRSYGKVKAMSMHVHGEAVMRSSEVIPVKDVNM